MTVIEDLLAASLKATPPGVSEARPARRLAVVTCMDTRIDPRAVFGLALGEAHVLRNGGGRVTDDVLRSLALSSSILGVDTVVLMQHTQCGLEGASDVDLRRRTGADIDFLPIEDHAASLRHDVDLLVQTPYVSLRAIAGFLYDVETGAVEDVVRWTSET
jgi:carbonic anhydrase